MNKKMNNKVLLAVLAILILVFLTTNYLKNNNSDNILQTDAIKDENLKTEVSKESSKIEDEYTKSDN